MGGGGVTKSKILTHRCHAHHGVRIFANYDRISFRTTELNRIKKFFACLSGAWMGSKNEKIEAENFVTHTPFKLTKPVLDFILYRWCYFFLFRSGGKHFVTESHIIC